MLSGRMMDYPLTITHLLDRAARYHGGTEIASVRPDRSVTRTTYRDLAERSARLANALTRLGVAPGDRVGTLAWNHHQHLECYFGVPAMGAVVHTLNLRLHPTEIGYIANHAEDAVIVVDQSLWPLFEKLRPAVKSLRHVLVIRDKGEPLPDGTHDYDALLADASPTFAWPTLDERAGAMLCYTSGTTGNPKGALYSHRSTVLHALAVSLPDAIGFSMADTVLPVVPMFHASAWGLPYAAVLTGARLVLPGPHLDPASLVTLMERERVTVAGGVPTIWLGILQLLDAAPGAHDLSCIRTMAIGGSAAPAALIDGFQQRHGLVVTHAWGMTETNPVGTVARLKPHLRGDAKRELALRATQGVAMPFVETRHVDDAGTILHWDGTTVGELEVRGPWVASSYFNDEGADRYTADGWFRTGDVVTIDGEGYVSITDRAKDVIKSGGEWISSVALENALMAHPAVAEAAVFAARHPKWQERPVAAIVWKPGQRATDDELRAHLAAQFTPMALPDAYVEMAQIPRNSTGKFLKSKLRELHGELLIERGTKA
ncbi:MAG: long-chain fatty acid--CoA ligase [Myxococcota bacterium]|nr:long-chain fatty acid--CoA ligase [Myxococcota bacterium]